MFPLLRSTNITKKFGALTALQDVSLEIHAGEVVALLGDNGAGKSTFVKIVSGAYPQTMGKLFIEGQEVHFSSPRDAAQFGIATIFQELALAENLSVTENIFLGHELNSRIAGIPFLKRKAMRERVQSLLTDLDAHIVDVEALVGSLSGGQRQAVAIARALQQQTKLIIMDEPTAALAVLETRKVLNLINSLAHRGCAVLLVSHNIADVFEVADRIIVFRRGRQVAARLRQDTTPDEIVSLITGAHPDIQALEAAYYSKH